MGRRKRQRVRETETESKRERGRERERERGRERERERERDGWEEGREMWILRETISFVGGVRERKEKIIEERERRNAICCMCRCHAHLPPLTKFSR